MSCRKQFSLITVFFCFQQKTAYELRISDWSSDVCSSDLDDDAHAVVGRDFAESRRQRLDRAVIQCIQFFGAIDTHQGNTVTDRFNGNRRLRSEERRVGKEWVRTVRSEGVDGSIKKQKMSAGDRM